jgi:hypothetical protein
MATNSGTYRRASKPWSPQPERRNNPKVGNTMPYNKRGGNSNKGFMNAMEKTRATIYNLTLTENGAVAHSTSGSKLLDMNFAVASLRGKPEAEIVKMFRAAFNENPILAMRWLFYVRDVREGLGERTLFRVCLNDLAKNQQEVLVNALIPYVAEYGRWDDIFSLIDNKKCKTAVLKVIKTQWDADDKGMVNGESISLMAKWLPSEQASNLEAKKRAGIISSYLKLTPRQYRKALSAFRAYIDVIERKMSSNNWQSIDYETVPSQANLRYKNAFLKHDEIRRRAYLGALERGEAKINSSVTFPHDIVHKYYGNAFHLPSKEDAALESMWKSLPDMVQGESSTIVVADGSGSMGVRVGNTNITALQVANALAIYFAERCKGEFQNKYITFSNTPRIVNLNGGSLLKNLGIAMRHCEVASTNIQAVFNLILETAKRNRMSQEEIPANILIVSDMEFNSAVTCNTYNCSSKTLFDRIKQKYEQAGYKLPRVIFWNVNSRTKAIPMVQNELGVTLVSGFSVNICKSVMTNCVDPYDALVETIQSKRYDVIEKVMRDIC